MLLGALVDAGVPFGVLKETATALNLGVELEVRKVSRGGLAATKVDVITQNKSGVRDQGSEKQGARERGNEGTRGARAHSHPHGDHEHEHQTDEHEHPFDGVEHAHHYDDAPHRSLSTILGIIQAAPLSEFVKERSMRAFRLLGEAEAVIHSIPIEKVHFHEVGAVDTIVDIVCAASGCEALGVDRWLSSPLNVGSGTVKCAHGTLPVPAPATLALIGDAPVYAAGPPMERVTPTGAALLRMLEVTYGSTPAMRVGTCGYGAGGRDTLGEPNLLRLLVGEAMEESLAEKPIAIRESEPIAVTETVIDDSTPQLLAYVSELLLEAGAWDVYRSPVQMKKGRTGVQLTVLSSPEKAPELREILLRETTTIGLRWRLENKIALAREFADVDTEWGKVRMKIARWASGVVANASPEYEDCRAHAREHNVPLKKVMQAAMQAWAEMESSRAKKGR